MNSTTRFFIFLFIFGAVIHLLLMNLQDLLPSKAVFKDFYIIELVIFAVTLGLHTGLMNAGKRGNQAFIRFFMAATAARLFIYMVIMILYGMFFKENAFGFILNFFLIYLFYTVFEVIYTFKQMNRKSS